jgi:perosamine synthetase
VFRRALAHADRGKPRWLPDFDDRNPSTFLFPALNHHSDEISCAIGLASLQRLNDTIVRRLAFVADLSARLREQANLCRPYGYSPGDSPFVYPILVDVERLSCSKVEFALAVREEGIGLNPHYQYVVADWPWVKRYLADDFNTPNARAVRDRSFVLYLNENYGEREAVDVAVAIVKVEQYYGR